MQGLYSVFLSLILDVSVTSCATEGGSKLAVLDNLQNDQAIATFAGGCFWCTEAVFERVEGVNNVVSGYTGGKEENPTYYQVSYGKTTHTEGIQIYFDPKVVSYQELLDIFFATHNPTELNRQGPDVGTQYRTAVYYHNEAQKQALTSTIAKLDSSGKYNKKIVTEVEPYDKFWLAEDYHQDYYELNPGNPYIINVAIPKVRKLKKYFPKKVKAKYKAER